MPSRLVLCALVALSTALAFSPLSATAPAEPSAEQSGAILNLAGRQRMLSQKMAKEVLLAAADFAPATQLAEAQKTSALFARTLRGLADGDAELGLPPLGDSRLRRQLERIGALHAEMAAVISAAATAGRVSTEQVARIAELNLPLLNESNQAVRLFEQRARAGALQARPALATAINLAGKQRMLSQKMAKELVLIALGVETEANRLNLLQTASLFDRTLAGLVQGDALLELDARVNTDATRAQVAVVARLWSALQPAIDRATADGAVPSRADLEQVARESGPLLVEMNRAVGLYEQLAR